MNPPTLQALIDNFIWALTSGLAVWLFQFAKRKSLYAKKSKFFGVKSGEDSFAIMNRYREMAAMSHEDIGTLLEVANIIHDLDGELKVSSHDVASEIMGDFTEFCIGGPDSNNRTKAYLETFLKGVVVNHYNAQTLPLAIITSEKVYEYDKHDQKSQYALLAKFFPRPNAHPVFLIAGQTSITNRGAVYFLAQNHKSLLKMYKNGPFCVVLEVPKPWNLSYKMTRLDRDITPTAFGQNLLVTKAIFGKMEK